jgi:hypothetical protein
MKASDLFPSPFLKKESFPVPTILTIKRVSMESVAKGEEKPVLFFNEMAKGMVLNKTKTKLLEASFGDDTDTWTGRKVRASLDPDVRDRQHCRRHQAGVQQGCPACPSCGQAGH